MDDELSADPADKPADKRAEYEAAIRKDDDARYVLRLYVTGMTLRSTRAISNIKAICQERLEGRYELEVVDAREHPDQARADGILAVPTLVKRLPVPLRRLIGDLSDIEHVLIGLDLARKT